MIVNCEAWAVWLAGLFLFAAAYGLAWVVR